MDRNHTFGKKVSFGAVGYSDFTFHGDESRKQNYEDSHYSREDWTKSGLSTAGFWSKHLLWNKPTLYESIQDIETHFGVKVKSVGDVEGREEDLKNKITH